MKTFNRRIAFAAALSTLALMDTAHAAGGRSGAQALPAQATEQQSQTQAKMQAEIDALRKDMLELKERQLALKVSAATK